MAAATDSTDNDNMSRDDRYFCVYIMGSLSETLYIGVRGNLHKRIFQHKFHHFEGFTDRYDVTRLLYWESYDDVHKALARETNSKDGVVRRRLGSW
jgi:putative endonuclease